MNRDWIPTPESPIPVLLPGVYDGLSARLAEMAGFHAIYASGGAISRAASLPDVGLLSLTEVIDRVRIIVEATPLPVVADGETGFGGAPNVQRAARAFEHAGVAAFHIEDQDVPKRCGALPGKRLISIDEMCAKVRLARSAVTDSDLIVVGRTDAFSVEGLDRAIERANAYAAAGADFVYIETLWDRASIERVAESVPAPKMISMVGGSQPPEVSAQELVAMGFPIVIVPNDLQRAAVRAMQCALELLGTEGHTAPMSQDMITMEDREVISQTEQYIDLG